MRVSVHARVAAAASAAVVAAALLVPGAAPARSVYGAAQQGLIAIIGNPQATNAVFSGRITDDVKLPLLAGAPAVPAPAAPRVRQKVMEGCVRVEMWRDWDEGCGALIVTIDPQLSVGRVRGSVPSSRFRGGRLWVSGRVSGLVPWAAGPGAAYSVSGVVLETGGGVGRMGPAAGSVRSSTIGLYTNRTGGGILASGAGIRLRLGS